MGICTVKPNLNKFEHVWGKEGLYSEVQCVVDNGYMGTLRRPPPPVAGGNKCLHYDSKIVGDPL